MFATDCIDPTIKPLQIHQTISDALDWCNTYHTHYAVICDGEKWLGVLSEEILLDIDEQRQLKELESLLQSYYVSDNTHIFDILKSTQLYKAFVLPVVNSEQEIKGVTSAPAILQAWAMDAHFAGPGGILVVELSPKDYSLAEIAKIVESNNASILHSMLSTSPDKEKMRVSLKINKNDLKDIQMTFERFNYEVIAVIHQSEYEMELQDRLDSLMKYLEV